MIPKDCKRLAEVDFPIAEVSRHAAREKSIRHGHPSTLHLWWARRPLASSRAVLLALLWPDPCDPLCPTAFKAEARKRLREVPGCNPGTTDEELRRALLRFIADFANWDNAAQRTYLDVSRALVKAAHAPVDGATYEAPLVVDPFAGGGSIPLEALRVGCEAFASDLNPVACLILKVMLEDIPRHGLELAEELRRVGAEIKQRAERELADLYPKDPDGATPIAYLWARTVRCESPNCGAEIPLVRSFWLCKKASRKRALRNRVEQLKDQPPRLLCEVFEPKTEKEVLAGTVRRAKATCPCCGVVMPPERVRTQLSAQRGGTNVVFDANGERIGGARLLAIVTQNAKEIGRQYRSPTERDYKSVREAQERIGELLSKSEHGGTNGLCPVPDEPLGRVPVTFGVINVWVYGILKWGDLFSSRQAIALVELIEAAKRLLSAGRNPLWDAVACVIDRCVDYSSCGVVWAQTGEFVAHTFGRQALPMVWDFAEAVLTSNSSGNFEGAVDWVARVIESWPGSAAGQVVSASATDHYLPSESAAVWFTDPPYYDSIPYSYISDFFYVWLRRFLDRSAFPPLNDPLTPRSGEIVAYIGRDGSQATAYERYELRMREAFAEGRRVLRNEGIAAVVFAHKTTEGWEALLSGIIRGGWTITGSWPIATERPGRLRSQDSAALATSVHLICRPRATDVTIGDWAAVLRELPTRVADWMERLQHEGVRGADLVFACIGPALEIFSRYTKVETAEGYEVNLDEYLTKVWEVVGRSALAQVLGTAEARARNGAAGAVEEDARLTALFLWTLQTTDGEGAQDTGGDEGDDNATDDDDEEAGSGGKAKGFTLVFDVVRRFAQPLGIELPKWEGRVIETSKGIVRLLPLAERAKQIFGEGGANAIASRLEQSAALGISPLQGMLFTEPETAPKISSSRGRGRRAAISSVSDESLAAVREATTLDRVHAAMLLQAGGRTNALRALLKAEQDRGPDFLRLANALSALYPKGSEEKRLLDAMLLAVPR